MDSLQSTLDDLRHCLSNANERLDSTRVQDELSSTLHSDEAIKDKRLCATALEVVDLLDCIQKKLDLNTVVLADHFFSYVSSQCLMAVGELRIADALGDGQKTLEQLSKTCKAEPTQLKRVLRILYNRGVFAFDAETGLYRNNSRSKLLQRDHWTQWHTWIDTYAGFFADASRGIPASLSDEKKRSPLQIAFRTDEDIYSYLRSSGWLSKMQTAMSSGAVAQAPNIVADYPWVEIAGLTFLDVGGGVGGLVASVLRSEPQLQAGILDTESVIEQARQNFHTTDGIYQDVSQRVDRNRLVVGDFFNSVPSYEVYTMKWCLHNWGDAKVLQILRNIRNAIQITERSRLIIFEAMLCDGRSGHISQYADMIMLIAFAGDGHERGLDEWKALADQSGWNIRKVYPITNTWVSAIELVPTEKTELSEVKAAPQEGEYDRVQTQDTTAKGKESRLTKSEMRFLVPWDLTQRGNPFIRSCPDDGFERTNLEWEPHRVCIGDARPSIRKFSLDEHGFAFFDDNESLPPDVIEAIRANRTREVESLYYPWVKKLVACKTGARVVHIFDHTVRRRYPEKDKHLNADGQEQPATIVHCDAGEVGARRRLQESLGEDVDVDAVLARRVQLLNIWKPLNGPVQDWPLAVMDFRSSSNSNVFNIDLWKRQYEDHRQSIAFTYAEAQSWWYLSDHKTDENTFIKIWDSQQDDTAYYCAHCAFEHPDTPKGAPARESVEVRCVVIY